VVRMMQLRHSRRTALRQIAVGSYLRSTWKDLAVISHAPLMQWYER
jgi:hypothetical protein